MDNLRGLRIAAALPWWGWLAALGLAAWLTNGTGVGVSEFLMVVVGSAVTLGIPFVLWNMRQEVNAELKDPENKRAYDNSRHWRWFIYGIPAVLVGGTMLLGALFSW